MRIAGGSSGRPAPQSCQQSAQEQTGLNLASAVPIRGQESYISLE